MEIKRLEFDVINHWSEVKLAILGKYARAYSAIFQARRQRKFHTVYVDAFAGEGAHVSKTTGEIVKGSPLVALDYKFDEFHFIELDPDKEQVLRTLVGNRPNVHFYQTDCNSILTTQILPQVRYEDYRRGLCLLDPYGLHLNWTSIEMAGKLGSIDLLLNFPIMDMNRNVFWRNPAGVDERDVARMNEFGGDETWRAAARKKDLTLFGDEEVKAPNCEIARAFQNRLREVAGFKEVPDPLPMRGPTNAIIYYLFFASQKRVAHKIAKSIFRSYQKMVKRNG